MLRAHDGREFRAAQERLPRFDAVHVPGGDDDGGGVVRAQCLDDGKERGFFLFADGGQQDGLPGVKFRRQEFEQRVGHGGMAVAVARSNLMFGTASTLSPPKIRAKRPASAFEMAQTCLGAMDSHKPGMAASSLR